MLPEKNYIKEMQVAVGTFIFCKQECLLLKRSLKKRVNPGLFNGVGGRLEAGEDFVSAAIREIEEESGYQVGKEQLKFSGLVNFEVEGQEDWLVAYFRVEVDKKEIEEGSITEDGQFFWVSQNQICSGKYLLVDSLRYFLPEIIENKQLFFVTVQTDLHGVASCSSKQLLQNHPLRPQ